MWLTSVIDASVLESCLGSAVLRNVDAWIGCLYWPLGPVWFGRLSWRAEIWNGWIVILLCSKHLKAEKKRKGIRDLKRHVPSDKTVRTFFVNPLGAKTASLRVTPCSCFGINNLKKTTTHGLFLPGKIIYEKIFCDKNSHSVCVVMIFFMDGLTELSVTGKF